MVSTAGVLLRLSLIRTEELILYSPQQPEAEGCTCNSENILTTYKDLYFHGSSSWQYKCN